MLPVSCTVLADGVLADKPGQTGAGGDGPGGGGNVGPGGGGASSKPLGFACESEAECASGHCRDGVCCDTACVGRCVSCALLGSEGVCTPHPPNSDPDDDCGPNEVCSADARCITVDGDPCVADDTCTSMFCQDDVCCDRRCDGKCQTCNGETPGICVPYPLGDDPEGECAGMNGCFAAGLCCGEAPPAPEGACPPECDGGCADGLCTIRCEGGECKAQTITCPVGFDCVVDCSTEDNACEGSSIDCPAAQACTVACGSGNKKCKNADIYCKDGPCRVECVGGDTCDGTDVFCGSNSCDVTCAGGGKPRVNDCAASCSCPTSC